MMNCKISFNGQEASFNFKINPPSSTFDLQNALSFAILSSLAYLREPEEIEEIVCNQLGFNCFKFFDPSAQSSISDQHAVCTQGRSVER